MLRSSTRWSTATACRVLQGVLRHSTRSCLAVGQRTRWNDRRLRRSSGDWKSSLLFPGANTRIRRLPSDKWSVTQWNCFAAAVEARPLTLSGDRWQMSHQWQCEIHEAVLYFKIFFLQKYIALVVLIFSQVSKCSHCVCACVCACDRYCLDSLHNVP